jgi:hypothetical protein
MGRTLLATLPTLLLFLTSSASAVLIGDPTTEWTPISFSSSPDWSDDQSTGANEADIVGNASNAALYTFFNPGGASLTDGTLGFRLRLGADDNPAGFKHIAVVGLDIDADFAVDVLLVVDNKGGTPQIAIRPVTGDGTTPGQTAIDTSSGVSFTPVPGTNYDWRSVSVASDPGNTSTDIDADGKNDYFLSFSVDFQQLVNHLGGAIDETSSVSYVAGTSTNSNSVNQDWAGPQGLSTAVSNALWSSLGAFGNPVTVSPVVSTPEPETALMLVLGLVGLALRKRPSRR